MTGERESARHSITVTVISDHRDLDPYADAWDVLAERHGSRMPMLSHAWARSFAETLVDPAARWLCLLAQCEGELVGVLPLLRSRGRLGTAFLATVDEHTTSGYPLLAAGVAEPALQALGEALLRVEPDLLLLHCHRARETSAFLAALRPTARPWQALWPPTTRGSLIATTGAFEAYQSRLAPNVRRNLRKARNRAERDFHVRVEVVSGYDAGDIGLLEEFIELEGSGWKGSDGGAIGCCVELREFYRRLSTRLAARGWLEWHRLHFDDRLVASHLAVRFGGALVLPKIAYDEQHARLAPGNMLFVHMLERAFADPAIREVNCLTDMAWHRLWQMDQETYASVVLTRRRLRPLVAGLVESADLRTRGHDLLAARAPRLLPLVRSVEARMGRGS